MTLPPSPPPLCSALPAGGTWTLSEKHYVHQRGAKVSAADLHRASGVLALGYTNGIFELIQVRTWSGLGKCRNI